MPARTAPTTRTRQRLVEGIRPEGTGHTVANGAQIDTDGAQCVGIVVERLVTGAVFSQPRSRDVGGQSVAVEYVRQVVAGGLQYAEKQVLRTCFAVAQFAGLFIGQH